MRSFPMLGGGAFVDTEAVRVLSPPPAGLEGALREAWDRYGIPLAVTEVHNGCTRDEQMRWMKDAWDTANRLRQQGVAIEAVTAWAIFGNSGWNTLLTKKGAYETGAYDVRAPVPRATAMVPLLKSLSHGDGFAHPVLARSGWWQRNIRFQHPKICRPAPIWEQRRHDEGVAAPVLICGATGTLGRAIAASCEHRSIAYVLVDRARLELGNPASVDMALKTIQPWLVINAAGWVQVTNNAAERALRGVALGRKAWLFAGSDRGGERAAFIYTLIGTARLNDIDPQAWLADVLARIADMPQNRLEELLPWNWQKPAPLLKAA